MNIHGGKGQARPSPTCADPENFARGGPTLKTFYKGKEDPDGTKSGKSSAHQRNAI